MELYRNAQQTYGIEFRNQEPEIDYTLNIRGNHISGESTQYGIAIINNTIYKNRSPGKGSGDIAIEDNTIDYARNAGGGAPLYLEEKKHRRPPARQRQNQPQHAHPSVKRATATPKPSP